MTDLKILQSISNIIQGVRPVSNIHELLLNHRCYYLLSLYDNPYRSTVLLKKSINRLATQERYSAIKNVLKQITFEYAIIKGNILSYMAYGDSFIRSSGDIDLLVSRSNAETIKCFLLDSGFVQGKVKQNTIYPFSRKEIIYYSSATHQSAPYIKASQSSILPFINVDINYSVMWGEYKNDIDINYILSYVEPYDFAGITVNKLIPEMEFIALCLHHYKDLNSIYLLSKNGIKLCYFCDIFYYLERNLLDMSLLLSLIQTLDVGRYIYYCLYYTNLIFYSQRINSLMCLLAQHQDEKIMNTFGLSDDERKIWDTDFLTRLLHFNFQKHVLNKLDYSDLEKIRLNNLFI